MKQIIDKDTQELLTFHLTGDKPSSAKAASDDLIPALLVNFADLKKIRHDFPILLIDNKPEQPMGTLSSAMNQLLQDIAPRGILGERLRKNVLAIESEIRAAVLDKGKGTLSKLFEQGAKSLLSQSEGADKKKLQENIDKARKVLKVDGELIACNEEAPNKLLSHAFFAIQNSHNQSVLDEIKEISLKLDAILKADYMKSKEAKNANVLKSQVGVSYENEIDFDAMSKMLSATQDDSILPASRKKRIQTALSVLESQKFFSVPSQENKEAYSFSFDSCTKALKEYQTRLPEMVEFIKSIKIAQLEIDNKYRESRHDGYFSKFSLSDVTSTELSLFPSYLISLDEKHNNDTSKAKLIEVLSSDIPAKVLYRIDDVVTQTESNGWDKQIANIAMGLGTAYVLQTACSNIYQASDEIVDGLQYTGPALFSIYSGAGQASANLSPYLTSASAMQSRVFPAFYYNPDAGESWAERFSVMENPQPEQSWPVSPFYYEDQNLQQQSEDVAFTFFDFAAMDKRFKQNFVSVPPNKWNDNMIPASEYLQMQNGASDGRIPYILMTDGQNNLYRVVIQKSLIGKAKKNQSVWRNLQELGGINNSHALRLLEAEKARWEEEKQKEIEELKSQLQDQQSAASAATQPVVEEKPKEAEAAAPEEEQGPVEEPFIETPRCNSCNECISKNDRMFAYNENKQAYLKDVSAGTYRELVEAAELCKVAIIHPGKPKNPDEPDLEELMKRAEPFN